MTTPKGEFRVWTKRVGNNPTAKLLLLHGGPAATHEYFEAADSYLPAAGIEYFYYDQLGSAYRVHGAAGSASLCAPRAAHACGGVAGPANRAFARINQSIYIPMQGPSELGANGKLAQWNRLGDLHDITVPTLVIGATHDTMDPAHMEMMSTLLPDGRFHLCEKGSHMAMYDDHVAYFDGLVRFIQDVDSASHVAPHG